MATKTKTAKRAPSQDEFWGHMAEEVPRADVVSVDKAARRIKLYRWWVGTSLVLAPIALFGNIAAIPKLMEKAPEPVAQVSEINSPTKAAAMQAVTNWLGSYPAPLPGGHLLSWDGVKVQAEPSITVDPTNNQTIENQGLQLHTLTLVSGSGALFTTTVQVGYSEIRGAQVIGLPTLIPRAPDDVSKWANLTSWPNLASVTVTDPVKQAAQAWVKAYTSGDPDALRLSVGDKAAEHSYVPLVQATASDVRVEDAGTALKTQDGKAPVENPATIVARVSFAVAWQGQDVDKNRNPTPPRLVYDVLITQADTASPVIVAWGGAGTGEQLTEYQNAVKDREITPDSLVGPVDPKVLAAKAEAKAAAGTPVPAPVAPGTDN